MMDAFRINVENLVLFPLLKDEKDTPTIYDNEHSDEIPGLMQLTLNPKIASGNLYGDGRKRDEQNIPISYEITMEHNKWTLSVQGKYSGSREVNHGVRTNVDDRAQYFAMGYRVPLTNGGYEITWFFKCKLTPSSKNIQQRTENINYSTDSFSITALPLEYNGDIKHTVDTSDEKLGFTMAMVDEWLKSVPVAPPIDNTIQE